MLVFLLLVLAFVCFIIGAIAPSGPAGRPGWVSLGLAFWVFTVLIGAWPH